VGVEVDEELGGEERGEEGVDGVEGVRKLEHRRRGDLPCVRIEHVVVLGRDCVDDKVLPFARGTCAGQSVRGVESTYFDGGGKTFAGTLHFGPAPSRHCNRLDILKRAAKSRGAVPQ
jgi:hypothetical protein